MPTRARWATRIVCYGLLAGILLYVLIARYLKPVVLDEPIGVEPARERLVEQRLDPNVATWSELATLPGLGEVSARSIIEYRQEHAAAGGGGPTVVFTCPADMEKVSGLGPKTVEQLTPYLKFPAVNDR